MAVNSELIKNYLDKCGVKHSNLGFRYLVSAFMIVCEEPDKNTILLEVYEKVAEKHNSAPKSVEKAISYSIKHRGITNKEFIISAIDKDFIDYGLGLNKTPGKQTCGQHIEFCSLLENGILNKEGQVNAGESKRKTRAHRPTAG